MMKATRGNTSNLAAFSKLFIKISNSSEPHQINGNGSSNLLRIRLLSSFDGGNGNAQGSRNGINDFNGGRDDGDANDMYSGRNRGNLSALQSLGKDSFTPGAGRPTRGERQNAAMDCDYGSRGRRNDGLRKPISGDSGRADLRLNNDVLKFDDEGSGDVGLDYRPSMRELFDRPLKGEKRGGKKGGNFFEKFKLDGGDEEETRSNEVHTTTPSPKEMMEGPEDANEIFNKMKKSGLIPNAVAMIEELCKDGLVNEAMKLFGLMREKGTMPEVVVYTSVVDGFCKAQKIDDAKRVFKKMQDNGIVPNAFSYTVLIEGLCKSKRLEDAVEFCVQMLEAGHLLNVPTFTGLILVFCKEKGLEDAQKVIVTLKQKGFFLDEKAVRVYLDKTGTTSPMVWEAIFRPKKTTRRTI